MKLAAVRTVSETDAFRIVEGLAFPFQGRDTYGTYYSARTNFEWGLFPDVAPTATRAGDEAKFIRPTTFHHGFDPDFKLTDENGVRVGGWSPVRMDADGVWVRAQIDKRHRYYESRLKPLLDSGALGLSGGSAEHSVRIDQQTGEILDWPAYEVALTPVESNPLAQLAARAADEGAALRIVAERRDISQEERDKMPADDFAGPDRSFPIAEPEDVAAAAHSLGRAKGDTDAIKAKIIAIAKRKGAEFVAQLPAAWKSDEPAPVIETPAVREGRRNSGSDQTLIQTIHDHSAALGADCPGGASARSAEGAPVVDDVPAIRIVGAPEPPDVDLTAIATRAAETAAADAVRRLLG